MTSIADQFKEKIEHGGLPEPIPRWRVQAKRAAIWILFGSFVVIGIASSGVAVWFMSDPNGLVMEYKNGDFLYQILAALPLFWIILSLVLAVGAVAVFVHAPRGYRYRTAVIGVAILLAFVAFGGAVSATGLSDRIEAAASMMPGYEMMQRPRLQQFIQLEQDRIIGRIKETGEGQLLLQDPRGIVWQVDVRECNPREIDRASTAKCVLIIGVPGSADYAFTAEVLRPCPRGIRIQHVQQFMPQVMPPQKVKEPVR